MEIGLFVVLLHSSFSLSRGEERASGAGEGGSVGDYYEVINKRISQSFFLSHFWPLGAAYMAALTGGDSLIIRPKAKEYVYAHSHLT